MFEPVPVRKLLFYRQKQPIYDEWEKAGLLDEMSEGLPERNDFLSRLAQYKDKGGCIVFFDDMSSLVQNYEEDFIHYWTIASHHSNVSFFLVLHSLFSPALRMLSLNTHRFFLTKSPRDVSQVRTLASQAFPGRSSFVVDAYEDATEKKYGFLILDFSPNCDSRLRVIANIFGPEPPTVYQYKEVARSKMVKMENKFRKQALIPWTEFLRLQSKAETNNVTCSTKTSCGQSTSCEPVIHHCEKPHVYDSRSPIAPLPVCNEQSGKSDDHPSKVEIMAPGSNVTSFEPPSEPSSVSKPSSVSEPSPPVISPAPPVLHSIIPTPVTDKTIVLKGPWHQKRPSIKKVLGGKKSVKDLIPYQTHMEISPPQHLVAPPSPQDILPSALMPISPVSQPPTFIDPPRAIEYESNPATDLRAITYSPSAPPTSQRKKQVKTQKKVVEPARALENLGQKSQDSVYPKSLLRDQDIQPNPSSFPSKINGKKGQNMKTKLFLPSPPYTTTQVLKKAIKRKNAFSKPRPTLPAKQIKHNRGEKRKFQGNLMVTKKVKRFAHPRTKEQNL